ncbi:internalin-related protein [Bifidobacterium dolichotidis]|uniref:Internalin-related protein n=1 Tax=Bifidobacterium dolichotidis TaxID=2306976 RepID=A0A430FS19_9BIFI|nr:S-layer homology domain-containing protein [Bifidobacterium dolichotidis]RSX55637.1 internalin-related protein [Bifidobacterium dolichotidis]
MKGSIQKIAIAASAVLATVATPLCTGIALADEPTGDIAINETNFPDPAFRTFVEENWDTEHDGTLTQAEREAVTDFRYDTDSGPALSSLQGIEFVPNLKSINVCYSELRNTLDASKNHKLESLVVSDNQIKDLIITNNPNLTTLAIESNLLTSLDVTKCPKLQSLLAGFNSIEEVDLSHNPDLKRINLTSNKLSDIDVSNNTKLTDLQLIQNKLKTLDATHNPELLKLDVGWNSLSSINVTQNQNLQELILAQNELASIDVSKNTKLFTLCVSNNKLESIDIAALTTLQNLELGHNKISSIDLTNQPNLEILEVNTNNLSTLDVAHNEKLRSIDATNNKLAAVDLSHNTVLDSLKIGLNQLASLNVSQNQKLQSLTVSDNNLSTLDVGALPELDWLDIENNKITCLDLPQVHVRSDGSQRGLDLLVVDKNPLLSINLAMAPNIFSQGQVSDPERVYPVAQEQIDLFKVSPHVDVSKISNIRGGTLIGSVLIPDSYPSTVSYQYALDDDEAWDAKIAFTHEHSDVFSDVKQWTPHAADIAWAFNNKIAEGYDTTGNAKRFEPMSVVCRQDMAAFLRRVAKKNNLGDAMTWKPTEEDWRHFKDVSKTTPHAEDILWLAHAGIATGYKSKDGYRYEPMTGVYRQDMAAFLHRLMEYSGRDTQNQRRDFTDVDESTPHSDCIRWLGITGIVAGYDNGDGTWRFEPGTKTYRQDMAAFLHRLDVLLQYS